MWPYISFLYVTFLVPRLVSQVVTVTSPSDCGMKVENLWRTHAKTGRTTANSTQKGPRPESNPQPARCDATVRTIVQLL